MEAQQAYGSSTKGWFLILTQCCLRSSLDFITGSAGLLDRRDVSEDGNLFPRLAAYLESIEQETG